ncbi:hypothetical protein VTN96DRAFT_1793 [Rasamsonia emersonii]
MKHRKGGFLCSTSLLRMVPLQTRSIASAAPSTHVASQTSARISVVGGFAVAPGRWPINAALALPVAISDRIC